MSVNPFPGLSPHNAQHLILFTRYPRPGETKTRLIPALGSEKAAGLQRRLTLRALRMADAFCSERGAHLEIHFDGAQPQAMQHWLGDRFTFVPQAGDDLGRRMLGAFERSFQLGSRATVLIGSDCPGLTGQILAQAFGELQHSTVTFGPAKDGGYYLVGLQRPVPELFSGPEWGSNQVLADSLKIANRLNLRAALLAPLTDIDRPEDLVEWDLIERHEALAPVPVSVVIPALNEEEGIGRTVASAAKGEAYEIIVVDGGSKDKTTDQASRAGASVLRSQPGRARQMNAGASKALGDILLFIHADTLLPASYATPMRAALSRPEVIAGAFRFALSDEFPGRRFVEWGTNLRSRVAQMPYGDQGLFLRRSVFEELGGFADMPILEDYEFVRRLRRLGHVTTLSETALTSGRRWRRLGVWRTTLINKRIILGYRFGRSPQELADLYTQR